MPSSPPANPSKEEVKDATDFLQSGFIPGAWPAVSAPVARGDQSGVRFPSVAVIELRKQKWLLGKCRPCVRPEVGRPRTPRPGTERTASETAEVTAKGSAVSRRERDGQ